MAKKLALGKGLASLIQSNQSHIYMADDVEQDANSVEAIQPAMKIVSGPMIVGVEQIRTNPNQPRKIFKERELEELTQSIRENGIIQPLIVVESDGSYELVAGERRLKAAIKAGIKEVPVVIKKATDREKMIMSIIENVQRADLNCVEEALAYYQLMDDFKLTQEEVAQKLGKERSTIANYLRILKLPRTIIELVQKELLTFGHAKVLAAVQDREHAARLANLAVSKSLSVRDLELEIKKTARQARKTTEGNPFFNDKLDDCRNQLEKRTGFHFSVKSKKAGAGQVTIKFSNEAEFNDIYDYLLNR